MIASLNNQKVLDIKSDPISMKHL